MSDEVVVKAISNPGTSNQFGKGYTYRNKNGAATTSLSISASITIITAAVLIVLSGPANKELLLKKSAITTPSATNSSNTQGDIDIPDVSTSNDGSNTKHKVATKTVKVIKYDGPQMINRPRIAAIPPGLIAKAKLITGASNGLVRAEITEALTFNGESLIETRSILVGSGVSGEDRLYIRFNQVVFPDGGMISIQAQALDKNDKMPGLKGRKIGQYALKLAASAGLNFISGFADGLQKKEVVKDGVVINKSTAKNALLNGTSRAAVDLSKETMSNLKNQPLIIRVDAGKEILIMFSAS